MRTYLRRCFYSTQVVGKEFEKRVFLLNDQGNRISPWNDIPLKPEVAPANIFNAVIEIPRYTLAKMEINKKEQYHPIMQDTRKNKFDPTKRELRFYAQFGTFNYGCFPQTWENPLVPNKEVDNLLVNLQRVLPYYSG